MMTPEQTARWRKHVVMLEALPKDKFYMARYLYQEKTKQYIQDWMKDNP